MKFLMLNILTRIYNNNIRAHNKKKIIIMNKKPLVKNQGHPYIK